jgi:hypothetical protein
LKLTEEQKQAYTIIQKLIDTCHEDDRFKRELIDNPILTIEKVIGKQRHFEKNIKVKVEDQSDSQILYLNLPPKPKYFKEYKFRFKTK